MKSILEEFVCGNISPEFQTFERDSLYGQALAAVVHNQEDLLAKLNDEQKVMFQKLSDSLDELNNITHVKNVVQGYKLGVLMTAEAFITSGDLFAEE